MNGCSSGGNTMGENTNYGCSSRRHTTQEDTNYLLITFDKNGIITKTCSTKDKQQQSYNTLTPMIVQESNIKVNLTGKKSKSCFTKCRCGHCCCCICFPYSYACCICMWSIITIAIVGFVIYFNVALDKIVSHICAKITNELEMKDNSRGDGNFYAKLGNYVFEIVSNQLLKVTCQ